MTLPMNATELRNVSYQMRCGCPVWAALIANEYLDADDPLRKAVIKRAIDSGSLEIPLGLKRQILNGRTASELRVDWRNYCKPSRSLALQRIMPKPRIPKRLRISDFGSRYPTTRRYAQRASLRDSHRSL